MLNTQEKIFRRLQERLYGNSLEFSLQDPQCYDVRQSSLGDRIIRWKEKLHKWGIVPALKRIPFVSITVQKAYSRLTQTVRVVATNELLVFEENEFVIQAYKAILEREPEPLGMKYFRQMLRDGVPKEILLYFIAHSKEAKQFNVRLEGLRIPSTLWKYKVKSLIKRIPVVSTVVVWAHRIIKMPERFYALAHSVQELQDCVERLEQRRNENQDKG